MARRMSTCAYCEREFASRGNQRFCSDKCRFQAWAKGQDCDRCYYCGLPADTIDHVPPRAYRNFILQQPELAKRYKFVEVRACLECNSTLGAKALWNLTERKEYIKKYLKRRYGKERWVDWDEEELEELGYSLRTKVEEQLLILEVNRRRIKY